MNELRKSPLLALLLAIALTFSPAASACTRAVYLGKDGMVLTGRTMDWKEDLKSNLWLFPRGMARDGGVGVGSLAWTSKHGSVIAAGYDVGTADGMNEKGLVANMLYLAEAEYSRPNDQRPSLSVGAWAQYVLDSFATVEEAVAELKKESFQIIAPTLPNGVAASLHLAISDPSGDSAIFEYLKGKLVIHHNRSYQILTNSPIFEEQLALNKYWESIGGLTMLPGTNRAADRYVRASFYINACTQSAERHEATASVFSVMRNISVPRGISTPNQPNISSTIWRSVSDQKNRIYYFEHTLSPGAIWVKFDSLNFEPGSGVRKLTLADKTDLSGDLSTKFEKAEAFKFLAPAK